MRSCWLWKIPVGLVTGILAAVPAFSGEPVPSAAADAKRVRVPAGFQVSVFADDDLAGNIYSLTVDSLGRVVVAGPGYVRILVDRDGDGRAESFKTFSNRPASGAQGLFFDGRDLLASGDGALWRFRDRDGDDRADGSPERLLEIRAGGEHDAHAIRRGPDGWFYLLAGNNAGVTSRYATLKSSPIRVPVSGTLLRLAPSLKGSEILVDGFRNAYDFAFNAAGDVFVYDSDGERDVSLPWYRPTRVFHALPASGTGWISRSWKKPDYFLDMPPVVGAFGRGSPTGVVCYRHRAFPGEYQGAVFALDWTFGRVVVVKLTADGGSYSGTPLEFMTGRGHFGFAPTDIAVGPDGAMYVSVGGRGTRGSVYRVTHPATASAAPTSAGSTLGDCLGMPQPLASWSRQRWSRLARKVGAAGMRAAILDDDRPSSQRVRAVEILVELFEAAGLDLLSKSAAKAPAAVRARIAWAIGRANPLRPDLADLAPFLADRDPQVGRAACEALLGAEKGLQWRLAFPGLLQQLDSRDRWCRRAAAAAVGRMPAGTWKTFQRLIPDLGPRARVAAWLGGGVHVKDLDRRGLAVALDVLAGKSSEDVADSLKLEAVRLAQLALGDVGPVQGRPAVFDGYGARLPAEVISPVAGEVARHVLAAFPSGHRELDHELARLAAMVSAAEPALLERFLARLDNDSHPVDDLHFLIATARLPLQRTVAQRRRIAGTLIAIQGKIDRLGLNQDRNWGDRVGELYATLSRLDPGLPLALLAAPGFGTADHAVFLAGLPAAARPRARAAFVRAIRRAGPDYEWTGAVVRFLGKSSEPEVREIVRGAYQRFDVRSSVLLELARRPEPSDRVRFVDGLESSSLEVLSACLDALAGLPPGRDAAEQLALLQTVRRLGFDSREHALRSRAVVLLRKNTGRRLGFETGADGRKAQREAIDRWTGLLETTYPEEARRRLGAAAVDLPSLRKRLAVVDWKSGDAVRGREVFARRGCVQCHQGRRALGPDLAGSAGRFSRADLFTSILLPNRDVSPRYQTTLIQTVGGQVFTGLVVYDSVDGLTLRTGTNQTIRVEAREIEFRARRPESLMPAGLLKGLANRDFADLYAYLRTLRR
ncbi:MAG: hypothetical protein QF363_04080 [Planctomycetaceae bacterium]|nr:hypothetical protein [Planctomycetaceae bacterium]